MADQNRVAKSDVFRLDSVHKESIGAAHGLHKNQYVRFFGERDCPVTSLIEVESVTSEAYRKKRLLKVETVSVEGGDPDCCTRFYRLMKRAH